MFSPRTFMQQSSNTFLELIQDLKRYQCPPEDSELVNVKCQKDEGTSSFLFPTFQARQLK